MQRLLEETKAAEKKKKELEKKKKELEKKKKEEEKKKKEEEKKTFEEELEEQLTDEEIANFQIEKMDMERLTNKVCEIVAVVFFFFSFLAGAFFSSLAAVFFFFSFLAEEVC